MKIFYPKLLIIVLLFAGSVIASNSDLPLRLLEELKSCKFLVSPNESLSISDINRSGGYFFIVPLQHTKEFTNWEFVLYRKVNCTNDTLCHQKCRIPIKQGNDDRIHVDNQLNNCKLFENAPKYIINLIRHKREKENIVDAPAKLISHDDVVEYIDREKIKLADRYLGGGKDFATSFVNATKQEINNETMYNIFIRLMELECITEGIAHNCVTNDNTPYRLCKIEVIIKHQDVARIITFRSFCGEVNIPLTT